MAHEQTGKVRAGLFVPLCLAMAAPFALVQVGRPAPETVEPIAPLADTQAADPGYSERFAKLYGTAPERTDVLDALAVFQRSLITPDARFDRYLKGVRNAITSDEEKGYRLFKAYGCIACHQGVNIGGNLFQKF